MQVLTMAPLSLCNPHCLKVGSLEEVCLGRQFSKNGLAGEIVDGEGAANRFSAGELSSLFEPQFDSRSNFHDKMACKCCSSPDSNGWLHLKTGHPALAEADPCLARAAEESGCISMGFTKVTDASGRGFGPVCNEARD